MKKKLGARWCEIARFEVEYGWLFLKKSLEIHGSHMMQFCWPHSVAGDRACVDSNRGSFSSICWISLVSLVFHQIGHHVSNAQNNHISYIPKSGSMGSIIEYSLIEYSWYVLIPWYIMTNQKIGRTFLFHTFPYPVGLLIAFTLGCTECRICDSFWNRSQLHRFPDNSASSTTLANLQQPEGWIPYYAYINQIT